MLRQTSPILMNHKKGLSTTTAFSFCIRPICLNIKPFIAPPGQICSLCITFEIEMAIYSVKPQFYAAWNPATSDILRGMVSFFPVYWYRNGSGLK